MDQMQVIGFHNSYHLKPAADVLAALELVSPQLAVRTRADVPTEQARTNDTTRQEAAFARGAQYVSTDYYRPDTTLSDYVVALPGGAVAICNPVTAPDDCDPDDLAG
jgi:hypothetical protein